MSFRTAFDAFVDEYITKHNTNRTHVFDDQRYDLLLRQLKHEDKVDKKLAKVKKKLRIAVIDNREWLLLQGKDDLLKQIPRLNPNQ